MGELSGDLLLQSDSVPAANPFVQPASAAALTPPTSPILTVADAQRYIQANAQAYADLVNAQATSAGQSGNLAYTMPPVDATYIKAVNTPGTTPAQQANIWNQKVQKTSGFSPQQWTQPLPSWLPPGSAPTTAKTVGDLYLAGYAKQNPWGFGTQAPFLGPNVNIPRETLNAYSTRAQVDQYLQSIGMYDPINSILLGGALRAQPAGFGNAPITPPGEGRGWNQGAPTPEETALVQKFAATGGRLSNAEFNRLAQLRSMRFSPKGEGLAPQILRSALIALMGTAVAGPIGATYGAAAGAGAGGLFGAGTAAMQSRGDPYATAIGGASGALAGGAAPWLTQTLGPVAGGAVAGGTSSGIGQGVNALTGRPVNPFAPLFGAAAGAGAGAVGGGFPGQIISTGINTLGNSLFPPSVPAAPRPRAPASAAALRNPFVTSALAVQPKKRPRR